jgi:hypothetical protein
VITRKDEISAVNLEGAEDGNLNICSLLHIDGPELPLPLHEHPIIQRLPESTAYTGIEGINPQPKASVEGRQRKKKISGVRNFAWNTQQNCVRFEVFTAVTTKNAVFWDVALCRSCVNRRFGGTYRLHLQGRRKSQARNQRDSIWQAELGFDPQDGRHMLLRNVC